MSYQHIAVIQHPRKETHRKITCDVVSRVTHLEELYKVKRQIQSANKTLTQNQDAILELHGGWKTDIISAIGAIHLHVNKLCVCK